MPKFIDITGQVFGQLTVLHKSTKRANNQIHWVCRCACGELTTVRGSYLKNGTTQSCGCLLYQTENIAGKRFGSLVVQHQSAKRTKYNRPLWLCLCDCGNTHLATSRALKTKHVRSCGCLRTGGDTIDQWLSSTFSNPEKECHWYVYSMANYNHLSKPGIAYQLSNRIDEEYGELYDFIKLTRLDAFLIEQAVLHETRNHFQCPDKLLKWRGYTELRSLTPRCLFDLAIFFHKQLQELGQEEFAIRFIPTTPKQRRNLTKMKAKV